MRRWAPVLALIAVVLLVAVPALGITFGEIDEGRHPQTGALVMEFNDGSKDWICSGTLISETVFLTASHCTIGLDQVWVTFAPDADDGIAANELMSGHAVTHPLYGTGGYNDPHDIAVVILDEAVTDITPARLAPLGTLDEYTAQEYHNETFVAVGYGAVRDTITGGFNYYYDGQRRLAYQSGWARNKVWAFLNMNSATGSAGTCYGDSGGPHFIGGTDMVVSITVTGDAPCKALDQTYRVDTETARDFLGQFVTLP